MPRLALLAILLLVPVLGLKAQDVRPLPTFDVASVKPNKPRAGGMQIGATPGGFVARNASLQMLILTAFSMPQSPLAQAQLIGGPNWLTSDRFEITAKAPDGTPPNQKLLMLRTLLAERFRLVVHHETRDMPVYALVMARSDARLGPQLSRSAAVDCEAIVAERNAALANRLIAGIPPKQLLAHERCTSRMMGGQGPSGLLTTHSLRNATMSTVSGQLGLTAGRSVVDRTGLAGQFDLELQFAPTPRLSVVPDDNALPENHPSIFRAVEDQLGLKLESARGPVQFLVIDSVERPTED